VEKKIFFGYDEKDARRNGRNELIPFESYRKAVSDIYETDKDIIANIELPGIEKKDIKLNIKEDKIEIKVEKKSEVEKKDEKKGFYRRERLYSGFYRCFKLPVYADTEKVDADFKNGVLNITIPKKKGHEKKYKQIPVK
jgi:HSP20 family protein